ncbi:MAG TPA: Mth938-like domain-containing protein [Burkholderiales bacterium]|nr:Mth938-like domain-containing protein [Burkholderiales bacterium]
MKFHLTDSGSQNLCTGYGKGFVAVNQRHIETNVIILPDRLVEPWGADSFDSLSEADFTHLATLAVEVIILGTGERIRFPHPRLAEPLRKARIGIEVMDTPAACRTYNILVGEGRRVAAALFVG